MTTTGSAARVSGRSGHTGPVRSADGVVTDSWHGCLQVRHPPAAARRRLIVAALTTMSAAASRQPPRTATRVVISPTPPNACAAVCRKAR
jgi:hypothetical protein